VRLSDIKRTKYEKKLGYVYTSANLLTVPRRDKPNGEKKMMDEKTLRALHNELYKKECQLRRALANEDNKAKSMVIRAQLGNIVTKVSIVDNILYNDNESALIDWL